MTRKGVALYGLLLGFCSISYASAYWIAALVWAKEPRSAYSLLFLSHVGGLYFTGLVALVALCFSIADEDAKRGIACSVSIGALMLTVPLVLLSMVTT